MGHVLKILNEQSALCFSYLSSSTKLLISNILTYKFIKQLNVTTELLLHNSIIG